MAIVLNTSSRNCIPNEVTASPRPAVVPPASVWDPAGERVRGAERASGLRNVRTLSALDRTQNRRCESRSSGGRYRKDGVDSAAKGSNVGNYVLGAVFGAAVFIGTVWGGLSVDTESAVAPSPAVHSSSDIEAASIAH